MRRWARVIAMILLIAAGRGLPHFAQDDPGCAPGLLLEAAGADGSAHVIGGAPPVHPKTHCALCHWSRSLRSPLSSLSSSVAQAPPPTLVARRPASAAAAVVLPAVPARAPPSFFV